MDYTYENLKEMIKYEPSRVVLAMFHFKKQPEDAFQIVYDTIENEDAVMFRHLSKMNTIQQVYQQIPGAEPSIWDEILSQGKYAFLTKIVEDPRSNITYSEIGNLSAALKRKADKVANKETTITKEEAKTLRNLQYQIVSKESQMVNTVSMVPDLELDSQKEGDYPNIIIGSPDAHTYLFKGIQSEDIQDNKLSEALKKTADAYFEHAYETATPNEELDPDRFDDMQLQVLEQEKKSVMEVDYEHSNFVDDFENVYNTSLSQADEFAAARAVFAQSSHKGLLMDFEQKGGTYALVVGNRFSNIGGQSSGGCITLVSDYDATLHHELIHEFDTHERKLSSSPFFKKVFKYMDDELEEIDTNQFLNCLKRNQKQTDEKNFWTISLNNKKYYNKRGRDYNLEYLSFFATLSHTSVELPSFVKTALRFIDTLALAKATGNKQVEDSLMQSLQNDNVEMTQKAFDDYMKSAIRLAQGKPLTVAKRKNNIANILKQNQR